MSAKTSWEVAGEGVVVCNCAWGCPCQFNALPTHGSCHGSGTWVIREGYFGNTRLDGVRFAGLYWWPGAVHEGHGHRQLILDERSSDAQRAAIIAIETGQEGGGLFEVFAATCPNARDPIVAAIEIETDREARRARVHIRGILEATAEPIRNPATGESHRARIVLPDGFEYNEAEVVNAAEWRVQGMQPLVWQHQNTHSHLNAFGWRNG